MQMSEDSENTDVCIRLSYFYYQLFSIVTVLECFKVRHIGFRLNICLNCWNVWWGYKELNDYFEQDKMAKRQMSYIIIANNRFGSAI